MKLPFRYEIMYIKEPEFMKMLYDDHGRFPLTEMPTYIARDQSMSKTALGLVAFDSKPLSSISYFFVARSERYFRDYSRWPNAELGGREGGTNSGKDNSHSDLDEVHSKPRGSSASSPVSNSGSEHLKLLQVPPQPAAGAQNPGADGSEVSRFGSYSHRPFEALANTMLEDILDLIETTAFVYWCLVLEPTGEGKYKRVGLAMLYPHAFESMKPEMTEFEIT
ncbi:hypothetical protein HBI56_142040 [Parastagonospora nodorum]|nr:hypothetical protein HBH56_035040 [Parastagonospora nodorum]KAH3933859.1 hypothetical protein HBH54_064420 [Parastagonospora nodorum]KAH3952647.1 hypothetical protein HBH53_045670 [Parastagonospora nodorum]KAH3979636.1 hypothetical protein HBH51_056700 [Parastagonospora nodorum]KAH3980365.1 hypothetical protein HBH52_092850 [Parastagonospora nodorum]